MSWTWDVDVDVREVYFGDVQRGRLTIGATLHTERMARVSYRARDVEAFAHQYRYEETPDFEDEWVRVKGSRGTAKRGFAVTGIPSMLAERRSVDCFREP